MSMIAEPIPELQGQRVWLKPATMAERRLIYEWATQSDLTSSMMGPPLFPDHMPPTWEEFCDDYKPYFFDDSAPELGRCFLIMAGDEAVGQVNYNDIAEKEGVRWTELDIWLRSEADTGKGYGSEAIHLLCNYLARHLRVTTFMMQPSARNPRGIRTYEKAGFQPLPHSAAEAAAEWGPSDYEDSIYMIKLLPQTDLAS